MRRVTAKAPINVALCKYWGKRDEELVLPMNDSLSVSMQDITTTTTLTASEDLTFFIDGVRQNDEEHAKVRAFLTHFTTGEVKVEIRSHGAVPKGAGLASSAAGFAALGVAANAIFDAKLSGDALAAVVRRGSGSAVRSLHGGVVVWRDKGTVERVDVDVSKLRMVFVVLDARQKWMPSREAMRHTMKTSPMYQPFVERANEDVHAMLDALKGNEFTHVGAIMEANYEAMHRAMENAVPPVVYRTQTSHDVVGLVRTLRSQGLYAYATMDAGPNVKVLTNADDVKAVKHALEKAGHGRLLVSRMATEGAVIVDETAD